MKRSIFAIVWTLAASLCTPASQAATGFVKGTVELFRVHDTSWGGWAPPVFWFTLNGVTGAGGCGLWNGKVLFVGRSREALISILTASISGKQVALYYDDTQQPLGVCTALYMTVGDAPPMF